MGYLYKSYPAPLKQQCLFYIHYRQNLYLFSLISTFDGISPMWSQQLQEMYNKKTLLNLAQVMLVYACEMTKKRPHNTLLLNFKKCCFLPLNACAWQDANDVAITRLCIQRSCVQANLAVNSQRLNTYTIFVLSLKVHRTNPQQGLKVKLNLEY